MNDRHFDCVVVGGGPAGSACAGRLARGGARVALFEPPRRHEKLCGGCLTAPAWDEAGRPESLAATPVREAVFEYGGRARATVPLGGESVLVERERLDAWLLGRARDAGAHLLAQRVRRLERHAGRWVVEADAESVRADVLIGADGCRSMVRAALVGRWRPSEIAFGVGTRPPWSEVPDEVVRPAMVRAVFFDRAGAADGARRPHGYAYVFGGAERPAMGAWGRCRGREILEMLRRLLASGWVRRGDAGACRLLGRESPLVASPAGFDRPTAGDGWLLVGDAAGHVNPVTGEGIRYALRGGRLAAEAILDGRPHSYRDRWEADFGGTLRWGARLVRLHERTQILGYLIDQAAASPRAAEALAGLAFASTSYRRLYVKGALRYLLDSLAR